MLKKLRPGAALLALSLVLTACTTAVKATDKETLIALSDGAVTVDGQAAATTGAIYVGADIVYYEAGQDAAYGEGTDADGHTAAEAAGHTVVTITQPGTYRLTGALSAGQVAVDLGEDAETNPDAVVTLILDGVDITCTVAPAILFYRVYECGSSDLETAAAVVDTAKAGANVVIADGSVNEVRGAYVAKIYEEGTEKKRHKYDGAFYSKMSMNVTGGAVGDGVLNITATNEGLDAELHLTINGGVINITAQNDGINTNEDGVSVTTVNGGVLTINSGLGAEGDGIDSNGFLVINSGIVTTQANPRTGDGGLDADSGIYLNGGTVIALGSRNDDISTDSAQQWMELTFASAVTAGSTLTVKDPAGAEILSYTAVKDFQTGVLSAPALALGTAYTVYVDGVQQQYTGTSGGMMGGGQRPQGETPPEGGDPAQNGERPQRPDGAALPDGTTPPQGGRPAAAGETGTPSTAFTLTASAKRFSGVSAGAVEGVSPSQT